MPSLARCSAIHPNRLPRRRLSSRAAPYATAHFAVANYRERYGLFAIAGNLFNHESPLRPRRLATSKILFTAARSARGSQEKLALGNMDIYRDWSWAPDYVEAI